MWRTKHLVIVGVAAFLVGGVLGASSDRSAKTAKTATPARATLPATTLPATTTTERVVTTAVTTPATPPPPATTAPRSTSSTTTTVPPSQRVMPAVRGERLDVAKAHLRDAGYPDADVEVVGGGTFGALDQSAWTVCSTEPTPGSATPEARLIIARSC
jgi:hypothetical protein